MPILDVTDALEDLLEDIEIEKPESGVRTKGVWNDGISTIVSAKAVVQPASGQDLNSISIEGDTTLSYKKFYSTHSFNSSSSDSQKPSDIIRYNNGRYKVLGIADWEAVGGYKKAITEKLEIGY